MKVYIVIEEYIYDFNHTIQTKVFNSMKKAEEHWNYLINREKENSWISKKNDVETIMDIKNHIFEAWVDGRGDEFDTAIYIHEREVF